VPGVGEFEVEAQNVLNSNTMQQKPLMPSMMSSDLMIRAKQNYYVTKNKRPPALKKSMEQLRREYLPKALRELFMQKLRSHFKELKFKGQGVMRARRQQKNFKVVYLVKFIDIKFKTALNQAFRRILSHAQDNSNKHFSHSSSGSSAQMLSLPNRELTDVSVKLRKSAFRSLERIFKN